MNLFDLLCFKQIVLSLKDNCFNYVCKPNHSPSALRLPRETITNCHLTEKVNRKWDLDNSNDDVELITINR